MRLQKLTGGPGGQTELISIEYPLKTRKRGSAPQKWRLTAHGLISKIRVILIEYFHTIFIHISIIAYYVVNLDKSGFTKQS